MFHTTRYISNAISWTRTLAGACLLAAPLLFSCCNDIREWAEPIVTDQGEYSNLTLVLNVNSDPNNVTRTSDNPMGGEDGNGLRLGEHHENDIENLCVFAFADDSRVGVSNLNAETPVKYCRFVDGIAFRPTLANSFYGDVISTEVNIQFEGKIVNGNDAFLVLANMGDVTASVTKLGQIRDLLVSKTLTRPAAPEAPLADCTLFAMANANNSRSLGGRGTKDIPYRVAIDLERITARVDFWFQPTLADDNKPTNLPSTDLLGYKVVNRYDDTDQTGWMYISHIRLMNVAQYAPYALKRLALSESDTPTYLADEEHLNDEATQYVLEPHTWDKGKVGLVTYEQLYGNTRIQYVVGNYNTVFTTREAVRNYTTPQTYPNASDGFNQGWSKDRISGEAYYVLDYINENTVEKEFTSGLNTTSLLLKTKFVPKQMYYINGMTLDTKEASYGDTFWAMEKYDGAQRVKLYFQDQAAAEMYKTIHSEATYAAPVEYTGGDNYYTIWIRHDNNGNDALIGRMEYGIVRNNIYRIGVSKVLGPGSPMPTADENPEDINLHIYVRKWNLMSVPTINI